MDPHVSKDVMRGLAKARAKGQRKKARLAVHVGETAYPVEKIWETGFSVDADKVPALRGFVDIYEGDAHLFQCLIVASEMSGSEMHCTFKRMTAIRSTAPLDFATRADAPVALISDMR